MSRRFPMRYAVLLAGVAAAATACGSSTAAAPERGPRPETVEGPAATGGSGTAVIHRPGASTRYAFARRDSLLLEYPGGQQQEQNIEWTPYITVSATEAGDTYRLSAVLDSVTVQSGVVPEDSIVGARGTRWTATMAPNGEIDSLAADRTTVLGQQVGMMIRTLYPVLPAGGARSGAQWVDTSTVPVKLNAIDARMTTRTRYRALEGQAPEHPKSLTIESDGELEQTGSGTQFGQQIDFTASGTRRATYHLGLDGMVAGVEGSDSTAMTFSVPAVGQSIEATQRSTFTITPLATSAPR